MADALDVHEEQDAIARAKRGDCEAMERLIEAARPLIIRLAGRLGTAASLRDELIQAGVIGLMQAVRRYQDTTGRRVSFEYSMVRGVNDSDACAKQLANLIRGMGAHVNLIPINPVDGSPYSATDAANVRRFQQKLESLGVNATVRRRLGSEISAACGQLRRDEMNGKA